MTSIDYLLDKYDTRVPYEERSKESDKQRKREERQRELNDLTVDLITECDTYKRLRLTPHQKDTVFFLVNKFSNNFKMFHKTAERETIILSFIFYVKMNELSIIRLNEYKITSKYGLTNNTFEIIICKLAAYFMKRMPIVPVESTNYDNDILSRNGGEI